MNPLNFKPHKKVTKKVLFIKIFSTTFFGAVLQKKLMIYLHLIYEKFLKLYWFSYWLELEKFCQREINVFGAFPYLNKHMASPAWFLRQIRSLSLKTHSLTISLPIHRFSTLPLKTQNRKVFWYFQGVEKGCNGNEWVNLPMSQLGDKLKMRNEYFRLYFFFFGL